MLSPDGGSIEDDAEGILPCAEAFVTSGAFVDPDNSLYDDDPYVSIGLLPRMCSWRGVLCLNSKDQQKESNASHLLLVVPPSFAQHRAPTIRYFSAYASLPSKNGLPNDCQAINSGNASIVRVAKIAKHTVTLGCMRQASMQVSKNDRLWNLHWGGRFKDDADFSKLLSFQKVNHFPGTWVLGRKDALARHLRKAAQRCRGGGFDTLAPVTYSWPIDLPLVQRDARDGYCFIVKPPARARGEGIFLFSGQIPQLLMDAAAAPKQSTDETPAVAIERADSSDEDSDDDDAYVVQRYLTRPLLINGFKVDLRVYVVCTSFDPLRLYVFNDGLVRFASEPYPLEKDLQTSLKDVFRHLTNYSINKKSKAYQEGQSEGSGCKWSFCALKRYFQTHGWSWDAAWREVHDVVIKSFISVEATVSTKASAVKHRFNCFELYGFDILLDDRRKGHLIEVNVMPSLACGAALDKHVKGHMIADMLTLVGVPVVDQDAVVRDAEAARESKRSGVADGSIRSLLQPNLVSKPAKYDTKKWSDIETYFSLHATEDDKCVLRDTEEELRRCGGFHRVFPCSNTASTYAPLFETSRHFNKLLSSWEEWKLRATPTSRELALRWLHGEGDFPQKVRRSRSMSTRTPDVPRVAKLLAKSRVSSSPRCVVQRQVPLPPIEKRSVAVSVFTFLPVNQHTS